MKLCPVVSPGGECRGQRYQGSSCHTLLLFFFKSYLFILKNYLEGGRHTNTYMHTDLPPHAHSISTRGGHVQGWTKSFIWVFTHVAGAHTWAIFYCFSEVISRAVLEVKHIAHEMVPIIGCQHFRQQVNLLYHHSTSPITLLRTALINSQGQDLNDLITA